MRTIVVTLRPSLPPAPTMPQQFEHPDTLLASGAAHIKERLRVRFQEPKLHAQLLHRIVKSGLEPRTETRKGTKETGQLVGEG